MSTIVLCRNGLEMSKACVKSLLRQTIQTDILIVDNASSDGTAKWSAALHREPRVRRMTFDRVESVATAWNRALDWTFKRGVRALVVNNDTELLPQSLETLLDAQRSHGAGMVTCVSVRAREEMHVPDHLTFSPHPDFSCFLLTKWAWEKVGPFDEEFLGAYAEDCDYHVRMHRAGIQAVSINLPFLHHGASTLKHADPEERRRIESNAARNRERFYSKYGAYPGTKAYSALFKSLDHSEIR